ncbi:MAG: histidinol dehydrogenase, partial [Bdellovibrionaceae bacterium]|nr:histidinol dehydrogenase [Pseudobdellovibrionaceae bacterium]
MRLLKYFNWASVSQEERTALLQRPVVEKNKNISAQVSEILKTIKSQGDLALRDYTQKYDNVLIENFKATPEEILEGYNQTSETIKESLLVAIRNLQKFHKAQIQEPLKVETMPGVVCEKRTVPIEKIGLYIPGGTAPLPSTLLMVGVPARVAGCTEIQLVTPPQQDGSIHPVILTAAYLLGLKNIYKCGGAQAIAALAFGTPSIPKVHKIFGPGNAWVTEAKMQVAYDASGAAIDLPAGPSEVLVIADESASPEFVAADLLSQAEHDAASQVILVTTSQKIADAVETQLQVQMETLSRRNICQQALDSSRCLLVGSVQEAMEISNTYAPEHLILH